MEQVSNYFSYHYLYYETRDDLWCDSIDVGTRKWITRSYAWSADETTSPLVSHSNFSQDQPPETAYRQKQKWTLFWIVCQTSSDRRDDSCSICRLCACWLCDRGSDVCPSTWWERLWICTDDQCSTIRLCLIYYTSRSPSFTKSYHPDLVQYRRDSVRAIIKHPDEDRYLFLTADDGRVRYVGWWVDEGWRYLNLWLKRFQKKLVIPMSISNIISSLHILPNMWNLRASIAMDIVIIIIVNSRV